jgi:uncharacterized membrane protein YbhN (UPF0104 family)
MRRLALIVGKCVISVALLALLFHKIDVGRLWAIARRASIAWLALALLVYFITILASSWRWRVLLEAQGVTIRRRTLLNSFLVAQFFNNFLPSNIGGDLIRIRDSAPHARSLTLATTIVFVDRGLGLLGLGLVAATSATIEAIGHQGVPPVWPTWLWAGFLIGAAVSVPAVLAPSHFGRFLQPLAVFHPEWVGNRIRQLIGALSRFRDRPASLGACFAGAVFVQVSLVVFYHVVARALHLDLSIWDFAVVVPISFVVQMLPISLNGFGIREATFAFYFSRIGQSMEAALVVPLAATATIMVFSLSGAVVWFVRSSR